MQAPNRAAWPEAVPFEEEINRADEVYSAAKTALLEAVGDLRMGREVKRTGRPF